MELSAETKALMRSDLEEFKRFLLGEFLEIVNDRIDSRIAAAFERTEFTAHIKSDRAGNTASPTP